MKSSRYMMATLRNVGIKMPRLERIHKPKPGVRVRKKMKKATGS